MLVADSLDSIPLTKQQVVLTIGNFDGVHLGHRALLNHLLEFAKEKQMLACAFTYSNHPSTVLRPSHPSPLLCTVQHKVKLLEDAGIEQLIMVPFTPSFAGQTAEAFLIKLKKSLPFSTLILGSDAHIGKNREGDKTTLAGFATSLNFNVEYFPDYLCLGERISSSRIRKCLTDGKLEIVSELLGRPFSIYSTVVRGGGKGAPMGFPTANLSVKDLCLPPEGVYAVTVKRGEGTYEGIANLGTAPTVRENSPTLLEVHLFDSTHHIYGENVEVIFHDYIRPERKFESVNALTAQIALDIASAKLIHSRRKH